MLRTLVIYALVQCGAVWAAPLPPIVEPGAQLIPQWLTDRLSGTTRVKLDTIIRNHVSVTSPKFILDSLPDGNTQLLSFGFNGVALKHANTVTKVNLHAFIGLENQNKVERPVSAEWTRLNPMLSSEIHARIEALLGWGGNTSASIYKEVLGYLLWWAYNPEAAQPLVISSDWQAIQRPFIPGIPLNDVLAQSDSPYAMNLIWKEVVRLQTIAEQILINTGLTVDLINPTNLLVSGPYNAPKISPIDFELLEPSPETFAYYQQRGLTLPVGRFPEDLQWVHWPLMPESILVSKLWNLSFDQALDYLMVKRGLTDRGSAIQQLASLQRFEIPFVKSHESYFNIDQACEFLLASPKAVKP